jgi:AAA+ superfamily predicted ATPase
MAPFDCHLFSGTRRNNRRTSTKIRYVGYPTVRTSREILDSYLTTMPQRLNDRIRELCAMAVATPASRELEEILRQLRKALHEHAERLRKVLSEYPPRRERRSTKKD